ncbi:MAG: hypothetical protein GH144_04540 [Clostridia bacterium]|jgi:hypothetical protein|nr:hypothetical protein [Clostridia bacterium]
MSITFYDQKEHLLKCSCGYIWKPLVRDYKDFDIKDQKCPNCYEAKTRVHPGARF